MKAVGILERNCDLAELLAVVVRKLGLAVLDDDALERADVLLVDPMFSTQLERAEQLRAGGPSLPIICVCSEPLHPRALAIDRRPFSVSRSARPRSKPRSRRRSAGRRFPDS